MEGYAAFLPVADGRAEDHAVAGADREQGDLVIEIDEGLDDHPLAVAAHAGHDLPGDLPQREAPSHAAAQLAAGRANVRR